MNLDRARKLANLIACIGNYSRFFDAYRIIREQQFQSKVLVLTYHRISDIKRAPWILRAVNPHDFERQILYLRKSFNVLPIDNVVKCIREGEPLSPRTVIITFDDGYKDNYLNAYPILKKHNVPATINLITDNIDSGNSFWWDKISYAIWNTSLNFIDLGELGVYNLHSTRNRVIAINGVRSKLTQKTSLEIATVIEHILKISHVDILKDLEEGTVLSWSDVTEMKTSGITFGAHSLTHSNLTQMSLEEAYHEINKSKKDIETNIGQNVTVFCYPNGKFSQDTVRLVQEAGFQCGLTLIPQMIDPNPNVFQLGRVPAGWNLNTLKLFTSGIYTDLINHV